MYLSLLGERVLLTLAFRLKCYVIKSEKKIIEKKHLLH